MATPSTNNNNVSNPNFTFAPTTNSTLNPTTTTTTNPTTNANPTTNSTATPTTNANPTNNPTANPTANTEANPEANPTANPVANPTQTVSPNIYTLIAPIVRVESARDGRDQHQTERQEEKSVGTWRNPEQRVLPTHLQLTHPGYGRPHGALTGTGGYGAVVTSRRRILAYEPYGQVPNGHSRHRFAYEPAVRQRDDGRYLCDEVDFMPNYRTASNARGADSRMLPDQVRDGGYSPSRLFPFASPSVSVPKDDTLSRRA